mgnify:CR=1 FL=1
MGPCHGRRIAPRLRFLQPRLHRAQAFVLLQQRRRKHLAITFRRQPPPLERGIDVELAQYAIDVDCRLAGQNLEAFQQRFCLLAPVRLDHADDDIRPLLQLGAAGLQHLIGLADARCGPHEDFEAAGATFLLSPGFGKVN